MARAFLGNGPITYRDRIHVRNTRKNGVLYVVRAATVAMQRRGKHSSTTTEVVFSMWSVPRGYLEDNWADPGSTRVEAGSNTSTVTLRVVGGDEKGSHESETVKYGHESYETRTRK
jgi:hypothetical protein